MFCVALVNSYLIICDLLGFSILSHFSCQTRLKRNKSSSLGNDLVSLFWMLILWLRTNLSCSSLELSYRLIWQTEVTPDSQPLPMDAHQLYRIWLSSELQRALPMSCLSETQIVALTFEEILWWHFVKIEMKNKRDFPAACNAGGCKGKHCLPASLDPILPHARGSHQNNKAEAAKSERNRIQMKSGRDFFISP